MTAPTRPAALLATLLLAASLDACGPASAPRPATPAAVDSSLRAELDRLAP